MKKTVYFLALMLVATVAGAATFSTLRSAVNEIANKIANDERQSNAALTILNQAYASEQALVTQYGSIVQEINSVANANPGSEGLQNLKSEKDLLVQDRTALMADLNLIRTAIGDVSTSLTVLEVPWVQ